ncbi:MAG: hypothetical protein GEU73_06040 [Chloroflexi bacterium]|nr:hypothetical protein [Chloroflexota bacterium]
MTWVRGQSGNPAGRPRKDDPITQAIRSTLREKDGPSTYRVLLARKLVQMAVGGDLAAAREVLDRVEGKPTERREVTGADGSALALLITRLDGANGNPRS